MSNLKLFFTIIRLNIFSIIRRLPISYGIKDDFISLSSSKPKIKWFFHKKLAKRTFDLTSRGLKKLLISFSKEYMLEEIPFKNGDTIIDCGANTGTLLMYLSSKSYKLNYIGFEPGKYEYKSLKYSASKLTKINANILPFSL